MICRYCGGRVEWQGPLTSLTYTECLRCGEKNCQREGVWERGEQTEDDV